MKAEIDKLSSISCLVNNAGVTYPYPDAFCSGPELTTEFCQKIITINAIAVTKVTRLVLPKLVNDALPFPGVNRFIINMGSISGLLTVPYFSVYGATKAYVVSLTRGLSYELKDTCVRVQAFTPSLISTKMTGIEKASTFVPSPMTFVESALSMLGVECIGCGYYPHAQYFHIANMFPRSMVCWYMARRMLGARKRYLSTIKQK